MKHSYNPPHELLAEYVRTVLVIESDVSAPANDQPIFTNGMPALFCKVVRDEDERETIKQLELHGTSVPPPCWILNNHETIIAFFFKPFTLPCIFNLAAARLVHASVNLSEWNAHAGHILITELIQSKSIRQKIEVLENLILKLTGKNKRYCEVIRYATDQVLYNTDAEIITTLRYNLGINERTFQRLFKKYVGVTLIQYKRICQFQLAFAQLRANSFDKVTDVAFDNGFADQSHFIRAFKEFTQTTPNSYLRNGLIDKNQ